MQFCPSAVQMVGRLFGIDTTASEDTAPPFGGRAAFAGMAALALATAALASALALAAALVLAAPCFSSLSSFCSSRCSCCFRSAISASLPPDCAKVGDAASASTAQMANVVIFVLMTSSPLSWSVLLPHLPELGAFYGVIPVSPYS